VKAGSHWPWAIAGLFLLILIINISVWVNATSDSSHVILENYYERAVRYDEDVKQDSINQALGWLVSYSFLAPEDEAQDAVGSDFPANTLLWVQLARENGLPIDGAHVHLQAFHLAHSAHPIQVDLHEGPTGYGSHLRLGPAGIWDLSLQVQKDSTVFTHHLQKELVALP
jgi:nitrogen fixation protein FixH